MHGFVDLLALKRFLTDNEVTEGSSSSRDRLQGAVNIPQSCLPYTLWTIKKRHFYFCDNSGKY